jgi:hypothetical protein
MFKKIQKKTDALSVFSAVRSGTGARRNPLALLQ